MADSVATGGYGYRRQRLLTLWSPIRKQRRQPQFQKPHPSWTRAGYVRSPQYRTVRIVTEAPQRSTHTSSWYFICHHLSI